MSMEIPTPAKVALVQSMEVEGEVKRLLEEVGKAILQSSLKSEIVWQGKLECPVHLMPLVVEKLGGAINAAGWSAKANLDEATGTVKFTLKAKG